MVRGWLYLAEGDTDRSIDVLRSALGPRHYETAMNAGAQMRQEDAVNEAADLLREFGASVNGIDRLADNQRSREVT
jgi:hypothetical protein